MDFGYCDVFGFALFGVEVVYWFLYVVFVKVEFAEVF